MNMATAALDRGSDAGFGSRPDWQPLRYFNIYRLALAALFMTLVTWGAAPRPLGAYDLGLFRATALAYLVFGLVAVLASHWRRPGFDLQVKLSVFGDIIAITLLMHASGGVTSGFGMLLIVAIAGSSILTQGRTAIVFAAMASLAVLAQQIYAWLDSPFPVASYPHAGMLGAAFFATAYLSHLSARRIRASDALAAKRGLDLANLAQLNEHIIERMQSGILAIDPDEGVRLINQSAQRLLGLSGRRLGDRLHWVSPELGEILDRWRRERDRTAYLCEPAGIQVHAAFAALGPDGADGVLVFLEDASAIKQRAQQLKLASLGRMAASIAHEIRNPLSAVSHANQLLGESPSLDRDDRRLTHIIGENSARMNVIIENVLELGRGRPARPETMQMKPWLQTFLAGLADNSPASPEDLALSVIPDDLHVRVDPSQLYQVLWNLCENALQHAGSPPRLRLVAGIGEETRRPFLDVQDNGPGLSVEAAERIFEPFFTTRTDGTGLGLYIARELCEGNQASINHVATSQGCCFRITFPDPRRRGVPSE
jgi:two-component system sensor histidine kinase PilS (NtrC family)